MSETTTSIITIGRQYGSAGRYIGQEIAKYFGIKYYDKELLDNLIVARISPKVLYEWKVFRFAAGE